MADEHTTRHATPANLIREGDGDPRHGKTSTYNHHQCRCAQCRAAWNTYMRGYYRKLSQSRRAALAAGSTS